jgi:DNA-binding transcriptional ArsR family regulator
LRKGPSSKALPASKHSAALFAALGDETRLRLVHRLREGPMSIAKLTAGAKITRQAITKHLRVLEQARLVHGTRQGRERHWQLDGRRLDDARRYLDLIARQWDNALGRLREFVEE